jgi:hypothetical protein
VVVEGGGVGVGRFRRRPRESSPILILSFLMHAEIAS